MAVLTRRALVKASLVSAPLFAIRARPAAAGEFGYKFANNLPASHPLNVRGGEAAARILEATGGRVEIRLFPNNQLTVPTRMCSANFRSGSGGVLHPVGSDTQHTWFLRPPSTEIVVSPSRITNRCGRRWTASSGCLRPRQRSPSAD